MNLQQTARLSRKASTVFALLAAVVLCAHPAGASSILVKRGLEHLEDGHVRLALGMLAQAGLNELPGYLVEPVQVLRAIQAEIPLSSEPAFTLLADAAFRYAGGREKGVFDDCQAVLDDAAADPLLRRYALELQVRIIRAEVGPPSTDFLDCGKSLPRKTARRIEAGHRNAIGTAYAAELLYLNGLRLEKEGSDHLALLYYHQAASADEPGEYREAALFGACRIKAQRELDARLSSETRSLISLLDRFAYAFPDSPRLAAAQELRQRLYDKAAREDYEAARFYDREHASVSTVIMAYERFLVRFPGSSHAREVRSRLDELYEEQVPPAASADITAWEDQVQEETSSEVLQPLEVAELPGEPQDLP